MKATVLVIIDGKLTELKVKAKHVNDIKFICWDICHTDFDIIDIQWEG